ncbi:hypothetical protein QJS66_20565 [Kocuria rhizophila]|nr:hypothetical protein QJS66_20565 [Kocuria rhizophila]
MGAEPGLPSVQAALEDALSSSSARRVPPWWPDARTRQVCPAPDRARGCAPAALAAAEQAAWHVTRRRAAACPRSMVTGDGGRARAGADAAAERGAEQGARQGSAAEGWGARRWAPWWCGTCPWPRWASTRASRRCPRPPSPRGRCRRLATPVARTYSGGGRGSTRPPWTGRCETSWVCTTS